jgi:hypothetical protein
MTRRRIFLCEVVVSLDRLSCPPVNDLPCSVENWLVTLFERVRNLKIQVNRQGFFERHPQLPTGEQALKRLPAWPFALK